MKLTRQLLCLGLTGSLLSGAVSSSGQTVLFSDDFDTDSSANWSVFEGNESGTPDYAVLFAFDYSTNRVTVNGVTGTIPPAPNGGGKGVKMWVNKDDAADRAAVSIFPKDRTFTDEFALRFDMWLNYNGPAFGGTGSTEFGTFGIDHAGDKVNWESAALQPSSDGVWFAVTGEGGAAGDYRAYVGDGVSAPARYSKSDAFLDRDGDNNYEDELILGTGTDFPLTAVFPAPPFETLGVPGKRWVEVEIRQRTNDLGTFTFTWLMNNYVIAEHAFQPNTATTTLAAGTIMLGNMDIFPSIASPKEDNYVIYDNVRVVDLNGVPALPVVTVAAGDATAGEPADPGSFTISRTGPAADALEVRYRMEGTASNGVDYVTLPGRLTLAAGQASTNLVVTPINDNIGEATETLRLVLLGSTNYDLYTSIYATVDLVDDADAPIANVLTKTNAYERNPDNDGRFTVHLSNPSSGDTVVNFTLGGTAVAGVDYTAVPTSITIPAGGTTGVVSIRPINNEIQDGNRTVTFTLSPGTGYIVGTTSAGTTTIRDDEGIVATGQLLYSEDFEQDHTADWAINASPGDHPADLFFDYANVWVPRAPGSTGAGTHGGRLQANISGGVFGGVSVSPLNLNLTGDYVLRLDLWQNFNGPAPGGGNGSTQITGAGVGTTGTRPQWPGGTQDSVWFATTGDGGSTIDYRAYSSAAPTGYGDDSGVFAAGTTGTPRQNSNPYYHEFGGYSPPADQALNFGSQVGETYPGAQAFCWRDVIIQKQGTTVKWWIDGKLLATVNAEEANFAGNTILLMQSDINATSSSDPNATYMAFGLFDNVRVYALAAPASRPHISGLQVIDAGAQVQIEFTAEAADVPGNFKVQASGNAAGGYADVTATVTQLAPGKFQAVAPASGSYRFYRISR